MEAMQAVIIVGVAAVVLALIFNYRNTLMTKVKGLIDKILK
jgi:vacuolar-type H+-ATPase subunit I/STV1